MPEYSKPPTSLRFGPFELALESGELRKNGALLKLSGQAIQVLVILAEHPNRLVSREELQQKLWPGDSYGDFEHGLNAAVNRLRETLGDSATEPEYIETVPRRGYRFIGTITEHPSAATVTSESSERPHPRAAPVGPADDTGDNQNWLKIGVWILFGAACAVTAIFAYLRFRPSVEPATLNPAPFTAYPGKELKPTFSPDGSQIAFAWDGDPPPGSKGFDLYVKVIGSENLLRLTRRSSELISPAWSPDGTQIAFHRKSGADRGIYVVPALGGPERKLRAIRIDSAPDTTISWSPDGKWIAYVESLPTGEEARVRLLSVETLESRQIPHAAECIYELVPAFSHSGRQLTYACVLKLLDIKNGIYSIATSGGPPRLVTTFTSGFGLPSGIAWTADDRKLIFSRPPDGWHDELNEVTLADGSLRKLLLSQGGSWPSISTKGDKLAFVASSYEVNIWRRDLLHLESPAVKLIPSTREQTHPQYSPDGKHIAFESPRGGVREIWMSDADGTHLVQISNFKNAMTGTPQWSPDSQKIAFDSRESGHPESYIVDISELMPRKVVTNLPATFVPSWSHDGKWLYLTTRTPNPTTNPYSIYRCPAGGGDAIPLTEWGWYALESFDGEAVYFVRGTELRRVLVKPVGTKSVAVEGMPSLDFDLWTVVPGGIYFVSLEGTASIRYFDFNTKQVRQIFELDKELTGMSVSPDGRWIVYSQVEERNSDIMLVEHFH